MLKFLHLRQNLRSQEGQYFGQFFHLSHRLQFDLVSGAYTKLLPHQHFSWLLINRVRCLLSLVSGSFSMQFSQMPKLQDLSSQMPVLKMEAFMPQTSHMYWRLISLKRVNSCPMGHVFLVQGGIRHQMQYFSSHFLQMERQSLGSRHSAQIEEIISLYFPMKNSRLCCLEHLYYSFSLFFARSQQGVKGQDLQCWLNCSTDWMGTGQVGLQGQWNSNQMGGSLVAKKGLLHLLGHLSLTFFV